MKARDIIRTLAYQCFQENSEARAALEILRCSDFRIDEQLSISFLFKKLIHEPLLATENEVFIILDGVDEADFASLDTTEHHPRPEMEILLECLGSLPSVRLLFLSRPTAKISKYVKPLVVKTITESDNMEDINSYVKQTVSGSKRLEKYFRKEQKDPVDYFQQRANSIFLWVVIVLRQLEKAESRKDFKRRLKEFSEVAGEMEPLYAKILSKFHPTHRQRVQEILRWLVLRAFTIQELKGAVEWSLHAQFDTFKSFLEEECGTMLHIVDSKTPVQLIHGTFRSFIISPQCRQTYIDVKEFFVEEETIHCHALSQCLTILTSRGKFRLNMLPLRESDASMSSLAQSYSRSFGDESDATSSDESEESSSGDDSNSITFVDASNAFMKYAAGSWCEHLREVNKLMSLPTSILKNLFEFFHSHGRKMWITQLLSSADYRTGRDINVEEATLLYVYQYLIRWKAARDSKAACGLLDEADESDAWALKMLESPSKLGEYVGKTSAELWLYEEENLRNIRGLFWLTLKHYCKSNERRLQSLLDLQSLARNEFAAIACWLSQSTKRTPSKMALGYGFAALHMWSHATSCFKSVMEANPDNEDVRRMLVKASLKSGDNQEAISASNFAISSAPQDSKWQLYSALAYRALNDVERQVSALEQAKALEESKGIQDTRQQWLSLQLADIYADRNDYNGMIKIYEELSYKYGSLWWAWQNLKDAYLAKGNKGGAKEVYENARKKNPEKEWARVGLHKMNEMLCNSPAQNESLQSISNT